MIGNIASIVCFSVASFCYIGFSYWMGKKLCVLFFKLPNEGTKITEEIADNDTIKRLNSIAFHKLLEECKRLAEESETRIIRITNAVAQIEEDHAEIRNDHAEISNQHAEIRNQQSENNRRIKKLDKDFANLNARFNLYKTKVFGGG